MKLPRFAAMGSMLALAACPVMAEGGGDLGMRLIRPAPGTTFWTLVTFLLMLFILGKYAWKPLIGALERREASIRDSLEQARRDKDEAGLLLTQHRELIDEARRERSEALARGRADAERLKAELMEDARNQRDQLLAQTQSQIESAVRQAQVELRATAADLAIRAAEKLISRSLDDASQRRLVEDYIADLERGAGPSGSLPS